MKKLITLSFLLLMTSGAYAHGVKKTSKTVSIDFTFNHIDQCKAVRHNLWYISGDDIIFKGKCDRKTLKATIAVRYVFTPSQGFTISPQRGMSRGRCSFIARMMRKVSNSELTIKASCSEWGGFSDQGSVGGKIIIR